MIYDKKLYNAAGIQGMFVGMKLFCGVFCGVFSLISCGIAKFLKNYAFKIWRVRKYLYLCSPVSGMAP